MVVLLSCRFRLSPLMERSRLANRQSSFFPKPLYNSPDQHWLLYTQADKSGADLMIVNNFR